MTRIISTIAVCAALGYAPTVFAQAAGGGNELPSNAKSSPTAASGTKDSSSGSMSKSGGSMEKSGGSSSSSDASTGNAEKSGTTLGGDQKDAK